MLKYILNKLSKETPITTVKTEKIKVSVPLISKAIEGKWLKPLAMFHLLKAKHINGKIYDYKSRMTEIGSTCGVSQKSTYNYFKALFKHQLITEAAQHIQMTSITLLKKKMNDYKHCTIEVDEDDNVTTITYKLYAKVIEEHFQSMMTMYAVEAMRRGVKQSSDMRQDEAFVPHLSFSVRNMAKLLRMSSIKAMQVRDKLIEMRIIKVYAGRPKLISNGKMDLSTTHASPGHRFTGKNGNYIQYGDKIELLQHPVKSLRRAVTSLRVVEKRGLLGKIKPSKGQNSTPAAAVMPTLEELRLNWLKGGLSTV